MPSAVLIFLKMADEKQVIYFTWPYIENTSISLPFADIISILLNISLLWWVHDNIFFSEVNINKFKGCARNRKLKYHVIGRCENVITQKPLVIELRT